MNILFLVYWGLNDGLTRSTVLPHLQILSRNRKVKSIILITIERDGGFEQQKLDNKVVHIPWMSSHQYVTKARDFIMLPRQVSAIIRRRNIQFVLCRGTPAGAIGYLVYRKTGIDYAVESFEPHADYMRESGVWRRWDFRYIVQRHWEKKQLKTARYVMPVTKHYRDFLIDQGAEPGKVFIMPCAVDLGKFALSLESRALTRRAIGIGDDVTVGIYVGKFGGLYLEEEAFQIFRLAKKYFDKFYLMILSPDDRESIASRLLKAGYIPEEFYIQHTAHEAVPSYLSAADFAFATYKPGYSKRYLSPVKIGEYWAAGLPVLLTDGVGDDHMIIKELKIGSVFSCKGNDFGVSFSELKTMLKEGRVNTNLRVQAVAARYRNFSQNECVYNTIIDALSEYFAGASLLTDV